MAEYLSEGPLAPIGTCGHPGGCTNPAAFIIIWETGLQVDENGLYTATMAGGACLEHEARARAMTNLYAIEPYNPERAREIVAALS